VKPMNTASAGQECILMTILGINGYGSLIMVGIQGSTSMES